MLTTASVELPMSRSVSLDALRTVSGHELAEIATAATSSGEALLERSGLLRLDEASRCHFGAQLGPPVGYDSVSAMQLRWWNDRARSLTPGFIGELKVADAREGRTELIIAGEYHPRAHLYELVDRKFLSRMARSVVTDYVRRLADRLTEAVVARAV